MNNLMRAEWYKLTRSRALWLVLGVLALSFTLMLLLPYGSMSWDGRPLTVSDGFVSGVGESSYTILAAIVFLGLSVGKDFSSGALTHYVAAGHSRSRVVFGRYFSYLAGFLAICLLLPFLRGLPLGPLHGLGIPFAEWGETTPLWPYAYRVFALQAPFYIAMASLFYLGAIAAKSALGALLLPGGLYVAIMFLQGSGPWGEYLPVKQWEAAASPQLDFVYWGQGVAVAAGLIVLSLFGSWLLFRRMELR